MGGLTLHDAKKNPLGVLTPHRLSLLHVEGKLDIPVIDEKDIQDRSKADGLSKALVVVQTSWFLMQCIARRADGLIITQLELTTVALAALNGAVYFLWWHKPQNVQFTIPIFLLPESQIGTQDESVLELREQPKGAFPLVSSV